MGDEFMYIKYFASDNAGVKLLKIEKLEIVVKERVDDGEKFYEVFNNGSSFKLQEVLDYYSTEILRFLDSKGVLDVKNFTSAINGYVDNDRNDFSGSGIFSASFEGDLSASQFRNFIKALENAIENNVRLFDATAFQKQTDTSFLG